MLAEYMLWLHTENTIWYTCKEYPVLMHLSKLCLTYAHPGEQFHPFGVSGDLDFMNILWEIQR